DVYRHSVERARRPLIAAFAWMGVGMLTKGPIALLIPALASGIYFATRRQLRDWLRAMLDPLGWLRLLAHAAPCDTLDFRQQAAAFIDGFIVTHHLDRFTTTMNRQGGTLLYYAPAVLLVTLPFSGLLLRLLPTLRAQLRDPLDRFLCIWFAVVYG